MMCQKGPATWPFAAGIGINHRFPRELIPVNIRDRGVPDLYAACVAAISDEGALSKRSKSSCMAFLQTRTYLWSRADKYGCSYDSIEPDGPCALW